MAQNINWKEIAKMLNVETGVPFKIVIPDYLKEHIEQRSIKGYNFDEIEFCIYWDGFACHDNYRSMFSGYDNKFLYDLILGGILNNTVTIKRKRFIPKDGDHYYYVNMTKDEYEVVFAVYTESYSDLMNFMNDNCFKTKEEATAKAKKIYEVFCEALKEMEEIEYI